MDIDGRNPKQLVGGIGDPISTCSSDGRWALFLDVVPRIRRWWRVSVDGGDPVQLPGDHMLWPAISPDGKLIAYLYDDSDADPPYGIAIMPFEGGKVIKRFSVPTRNKYPWNNYVTWSRDGQALIYNTPDIWRQPLDGSPPKQITDFHGDDITFYDWSPDGKQLACVRMIQTVSTVLINDKK